MPESVKALTAAAVLKYKPKGKLVEIKDGATQGLYLTIHPSGTKVWCMKLTRPDGRSGHLTLGRVDFSGTELEGDLTIGMPLSLAGARLLAAKVLRDRQLGKDPIAEHKATKLRKRLAVLHDQANTFGSAARQFIDKYAKKEQRRWKDTAYVLGLDYSNPDEPVVRPGGLAQRWANTPVREIDKAQIKVVVKEAGEHGIPGSAKRTKGHSDARERAVLAALSGVFKFLVDRDLLDANPCAGIKVNSWNNRDRVLSDDELRWLWLACDKEGWPFGPVVKLLMLTGQRLNEIAGMRRAELFDDALNLPPSRTKNGRPHVVPLVEVAKALIPADGDWVFSTTGYSAVSGWSTAKTRLDAAMLAIAREEKGKDFTIAPWVLHDLRRTMITGMNELGIQPWVVEQVVNHISGAAKAGVAGVYNHARLLPERRAALERWASHLDGIVRGTAANVIPIKRGAR